MSIDKTRAIIALVWFIIGCVCGFFIGKAKYNKPIIEQVERDTVTITDTVRYYVPTVVDSTRTKYITRYLPVFSHDTTLISEVLHDTVAVQVPITQKHYRALEYDAWVSGYEANLDSINVYQKTQIITNTITKMKPPNKWELDAMAGIDYNTATQKYTPYAGGELLYKPSRLQVGIRGGILKNDKTEPFVGAVLKYKVF